MKGSIDLAVILGSMAMCLTPANAFAAEDVHGYFFPTVYADFTLYGQIHDANNSTNTYQYKICWDDPTFTKNCEAPLTSNLANGPPANPTPCSGCRNLQYTVPTGTPAGWSITPRDGNSHKIYGQIISQAGGPPIPIDGSPVQLTVKNGNVDHDIFVEASPSRLQPSQLAVLANAQNPYSVGSTGTTVCAAGATGNGSTAIKDDGVVGYYVRKWSVPCANVFIVSYAVKSGTAGYSMTEAIYTSSILPVLNLMPGNTGNPLTTIQAIAIGWADSGFLVPALNTRSGNVAHGLQSLSAVIATKTIATGTACVDPGSSAGLFGYGPANPYFNSTSKAPYSDFGIRPAMFLAGETCQSCPTNGYVLGPWVPDVAVMKKVIDAAFAAKDTNPSNGVAYWAYTSAGPGSFVSPNGVGTPSAPNTYFSSVPGRLANELLLSTPVAHAASTTVSSPNILMYMNNSPNYVYSGATFIPGSGVGWSIRSTTGSIPYDNNQTPVASWLNQGAIAGYGTAVEYCVNATAKYPQGDIFLRNYTQGQTVIEALWKSTQQFWQGNFVGDPLASPFSQGPAVPVTGPKVAAGGAVNGASFVPGPVSPGTVLSVFGSNLGPQTIAGLQLDMAGRVALSTGGTRVLINGTPAPMIYSLSGQVSAMVPFATQANATAQVVVEYNGVPSAPEPLGITDVSPALFTLDSSGKGQGAILNQDGITVNGQATPAAKGSIVVLYATGAGVTNPRSIDGQLAVGVYPVPVTQPVSVLIGGQQADVKYAGAAPGLVAGILQVNAVVPTTAGSGDQPIVLQVGTVASPAGVTVAVQ